MNSNLSHCRDRLEKEIVDAAASTISFYILLAKFLLHVEAGTGFSGKLVVTVDGGVREFLLQLSDEIQQGSLLVDVDKHVIQ